jgi:hypothetical protein
MGGTPAAANNGPRNASEATGREKRGLNAGRHGISGTSSSFNNARSGGYLMATTDVSWPDIPAKLRPTDTSEGSNGKLTTRQGSDDLQYCSAVQNLSS